jgi:peptide deformylase
MLQILTDPNPILHQKAKPVDEITPEVIQLIDDMRVVMHQSNGIGLAAPQVGVAKQISIVEIPADISKENNESPHNFTVLINPKIIRVSQDNVTMTEGCLSIPKVEVDVTRPDQITVDYLDEKGFETSLTVSKLFSRAIQHEIDHLNGILITDHGPGKSITRHD